MLGNLLEDELIHLDAGSAEREWDPYPDVLTIYLSRKGCELMKRVYVGEPIEGAEVVLIAKVSSRDEPRDGE